MGIGFTHVIKPNMKRWKGRKTYPVMCRGTGSKGAEKGGVSLDVQNQLIDPAPGAHGGGTKPERPGHTQMAGDATPTQEHKKSIPRIHE